MHTRHPHHRHAACLFLALCLLLASCRERLFLPVKPEFVLAEADSPVLILFPDDGPVTAWDAQTGTTRWTSTSDLLAYPRRVLQQDDARLVIREIVYQVLDVETGAQKAQGFLYANPLGDVMWQGDRLFTEDIHQGLLAQDMRHDTLLWQRTLPMTGGTGYWMAWDSAVFFLRGFGSHIYALHRETGAILDSITLGPEEPTLLQPELCRTSGETAVLVWENGLAAFHLPSRRLQWWHALSDAPQATTISGHAAIWVATANEGALHCIDLRNGQAIKSYAHEPIDQGTQLLVYGDWIWIVQGQTLVALQTVAPYAFQEVALPMRVQHGPFQVGDQACLEAPRKVGLVLRDNTLWTSPITPQP